MSNYSRHIETLKQRYISIAEQEGLDAIVLHSGSNRYYANDDNTYPFRPTTSAQQWLPYSVVPETFIVIRITGELSLYWPAKQDFWHVNPTQPEGDWTNAWSISPYVDDSWIKSLPPKIAVISNFQDSLPESIKAHANTANVVNYINYYRAYKTDWEIEHLKQANKMASLGHKAAEKGFSAEKSETAIYMDYLIASQQQQLTEPYGAIVGLNEAAAILHYENKSSTAPSAHRTLLIDAGYKENGYASDITRTYINTSTGTENNGGSAFKNLLNLVDGYQQKLSAMCTHGTHYIDVHDAAVKFTAETLLESKICSLSVEEQLEKRIPQVFFPHGIGHLLGLQVHDVGGFQRNTFGETIPSPEHARFLRLTRPLEENMVITIEPGLYFIPMLLEKMQAEIPNHGCDLKLIEELKPFGGIRVEDNIVVTNAEPINLTRLFL